MKSPAAVLCLLLFVARIEGNVPPFIRIRSGGNGNDSPIELNPLWVGNKRQQQQQHRPIQLQDLERPAPPPPPPPPPGFYIETQTFKLDGGIINRSTISQQILQFFNNLHAVSPALSSTVVSCLAVFVLWQVPICHAILRKYFVCSRYNLTLSSGRVASLLLSSVSHAGLIHLIFNIAALVSFGPRVQYFLASTSRWKLWPLLVGSALASSLCFLLLDRSHNEGAMGLSGVTLALLAVYARAFPNENLGILLAGILPVRMQSQQLLRWLLGVSLFGTLSTRRSQVAHSSHLGGLLFGVVYYEIWSRRRELQWITSNFRLH